MTIKIGELLIREKLLSQEQLEEALKCQVIFGGRLGTNLIEMGLLEEEDIARVLSNKLGVPFLDPPNRLMNIPPDVIALVSGEVVEKYQVVPLRKEGRRLTVAMIDPSDLKAIDEIAFRTGYVVRPVVAPEVRIVLAMEKYYRIERKLRYIHAPHLLAKTATAAEKKAPAPGAGEPDDSWYRKIEKEQAACLHPSLGDKQPPLPEEPRGPEHAQQPEALPTLSMDELDEQLASAEGRDDIATAITDYMGQHVGNVAMFLIRDHTALGWRALKERRLIASFEQLQIPLDEPSILKTSAESQSYYLGPIPRSPFNSVLLQEFGGIIPETALLVPLVMMGRTVGIIYANGDQQRLREKLIEVQKIASKAVMAFEILILRSKIRMM